MRTFRENLEELCKDRDVEAELIAGMLAYAEEEKQRTGVVLQPDSIRRKVRNWMQNKNIPTDREEVFRICFILKLSLEQSERLLARLTDQGIHYRSGKEVIYAYCLKYGISYTAAVKTVEQMTGEKDNRDNYAEPVTRIMKLEFQNVKTEEDLFAFILKNRERMGDCHNTAYSYFCRMLSCLQGENLPGEEVYSLEYVTDTYLRLNMPTERKITDYSNIQKIVKKYWPGPTSIKMMKNRSESVNRKVLLLLYLVTGGVIGEEYSELDEAYISARDFLGMHCDRLNQMLTACGMNLMDPRNVFDYLILYCIRPEDEVFMSDRMEALITELFDTV